jgi:hypothetical protein
MSRYDQLASEKMEAAGIPTINTVAVTQSRMEDSWDGLHYMRSTIEDPGHGLVSSMVQQIVLNAVFPYCGDPGEDVKSEHDVEEEED